MSTRDWLLIKNLRKFRYKLLTNIRPGTTSACHLEKKRKWEALTEMFCFLNRSKEFTILLLSQSTTYLCTCSWGTYKISRFTIRSIVYQWNNSFYSATPELHHWSTNPRLCLQAITSSHSLHAGTYLTFMPTSNIGEGTFHLLPKVIHLLKYSRVEYDSRCCSITPQCVKSVLTEKEMCEQDTEKRKQI